MRYSDKLNLLCEKLSITSSELARLSKLDPSLISRLRSGKRLPTKNSNQADKIAYAFFVFARENDKAQILGKICGTNKDKEIDEKNIQTFKDWLSVDEIEVFSCQNKEIIKQEKANKANFKFFADKLNALMNMLGISNIRLARVMNVDASLISRFRNGLKTPSQSNETLVSLCHYIYKKAGSANLLEQLSTLTGISKSKENFVSELTFWLSDKKETADKMAIDSFLDRLDTFSLDTTSFAYTIATPETLDDNSGSYNGIVGLRQAVLRFLSSVYFAEDKRTLLLYSDQNMDWLSKDMEFTAKWATLLGAILNKGNQIKIIHNIDRSLTEMLSAIEKWLPLYMSGRIEGFYHKKSGDGRFSNTLFVAPKLSTIVSNLVLGSEDNGRYSFLINPSDLDYYEKQFDSLLTQCNPLVRIFIPNFHEAYILKNAEILSVGSVVTSLLSSPSIATMPSELLQKMLDRNNISQQHRETIWSAYHLNKNMYDKLLINGNITEYVPTPNDDDLFREKVRLNLFDILTSEHIYYTPEEYSQHIKYIRELISRNENYKFFPLPENPFENIQIIVKNGVGTLIIKNNHPMVAFFFGHPLMCSAFSEYLTSLSEKCIVKPYNKNDILSYLSKYLYI